MTGAVPALVGFARMLRAAGVPAGPARVHAWARALGYLDAGRTADVYWAGRLTLCAGPDEVAAYDAAFAAYFGDLPHGVLRTVRRPNVTVSLPVAVSDGNRPDGEPTQTGDHHVAMTASRVEVSRHRDLAELTDTERSEVDRLLSAVRPSGPARRTRRRRPSHRGALNPRRTVRAMLRRGGEPARLHRHTRSDRPRRMVLLVDVSGSMSAYSDGLLRFAHAACRRRPSTEVFTIGTRLTRVSRELRGLNPDAALAAACSAVPDWSGGTRLGEQLKAFLDRWGQRGMARGAVVVVASDGWERGDVAQLGEQMQRLNRLAYRVVWVSPHAGKGGFAPATAGLRAALPSIDILLPGHNVQALARLAALLSQEDLDA
ncbi:MAG: VWA domain-containing protein [Jiangellaceae bacterium]